jgi:uncharacterized membrane protein YhaH (DUF805 family)
MSEGMCYVEWYLKPWKNFADFSGRSRRKEFWTFTLINGVISIIIGVSIALTTEVFCGSPSDIATLQSFTMSPGYQILRIFSLITFIPSLAVTVRRLHDTNRSGWFILISLIPIVGGTLIMVWMCTDSTLNENDYGPDPKAEIVDGTYNVRYY